MTENSLIAEFLNYLKFERHFSPHTAKCYAADLAQFCAFLAGDKEAASGRQNFSSSAFIGARTGAVGQSGTPGGSATAVLTETSLVA
jgi:site-specific recombinase XerD